MPCPTRTKTMNSITFFRLGTYTRAMQCTRDFLRKLFRLFLVHKIHSFKVDTIIICIKIKNRTKIKGHQKNGVPFDVLFNGMIPTEAVRLLISAGLHILALSLTRVPAEFIVETRHTALFHIFSLFTHIKNSLQF